MRLLPGIVGAPALALVAALLVGVTAAVCVVAIGSLLGLVAGYFGGWTDTVVMRLADIVLGLESGAALHGVAVPVVDGLPAPDDLLGLVPEVAVDIDAIATYLSGSAGWASTS